jgi:sugar phosphate isomerase/epimerase
MRKISLAYLTTHRCTAVESLQVAHALDCQHVGLRLLPVMVGGACQALLGDTATEHEVQAVIRDTGVTPFDLEIIRLTPDFQLADHLGFLELGQRLQARAVLVAGLDDERARLADNFARLSEACERNGLTADLEFMPWTPVSNAREAWDVLQRAGRPRAAGVLVDALHVGRSSTTLDDLRNLPTEHLHYVQLCDAQAGTHFSTEQLLHTARCARLMPGEGNVGVGDIVDALPQALPLSIEVVHLEREAAHTPLEWARLCLQASQAFFGRGH